MDALHRRAFVTQMFGATLCLTMSGALLLSFPKPGHAKSAKKECEDSGGRWVGSSRNDGHCFKHLPPDELPPIEPIDAPDPPFGLEPNKPRAIGKPEPAALSR